MASAADIASIRADVVGADALVGTAGDRTILVTSTFLDGSTRYTAGQQYVLDAGPAHYFVTNGWATDLG